MREDAHDALTLALHLEPERPAVHLNLGVLALEAGEAEEAAAYFAEAVRLDPAYVEAWSNLGLVQLQHLGRLDEAEASLQRALAARPGFLDALTNLGMLRHDQGRFKEAQGALRQGAARGFPHARGASQPFAPLPGAGGVRPGLAGIRGAPAGESALRPALRALSRMGWRPRPGAHAPRLR